MAKQTDSSKKAPAKPDKSGKGTAPKGGDTKKGGDAKSGAKKTPTKK